MSTTVLVCDVINASDEDELDTLVSASKTYWTKKGYQLKTDDSGPDFLSVIESRMKDGMYLPGQPKKTFLGQAILIYEPTS